MIGSNIKKDCYSDIVRFREKIVSDLYMIKKLDQISTRKRQISVIPTNKTFQLNQSVLNKSEKELFLKPLPQVSNFYANSNQSTKKLSKNKSISENMLNSKLRSKFIKDGLIYKDNANFNKRLIRLKSPLSRDKMNESWRQNSEYKEIARKVKKFDDIRKSVMHLKLPPLTLKGNGDIRKLLNI